MSLTSKRKGHLLYFEKFGDINERGFKRIRRTPRVAPEAEPYEDEPQQGEDVYSVNMVEQMQDDDKIDAREAGFMIGYLDA